MTQMYEKEYRKQKRVIKTKIMSKRWMVLAIDRMSMEFEVEYFVKGFVEHA